MASDTSSLFLKFDICGERSMLKDALMLSRDLLFVILEDETKDA